MLAYPSSALVIRALSNLADLTHELSNSMGMVMNCLELEVGRREGASDCVQVAANLAIRSNNGLRRLMYELKGLIRLLEGSEDQMTLEYRLKIKGR